MENKNKNLEDKITLFAETNYRSQKTKFGIKTDDRRRHMYLIGKTGMGKSTMLENMIVSDIQFGRGVSVIDPHGDLVEKILNYIPNNRVNDVVYFNPSDLEYPIAFNILENVDPHYRHLVASGLIGIFKKLWAETWGPRLEYVLRNAILALLDFPGSTLLGIMRILVDKSYRKKVVSRIQDPVVKSFWLDEYSKYPDRFQVEAINPIQNKVGQFLSNPLIRNIVGQVKSTINARDIMDNKKIFLLNLAKGRIGEDTSALLGAMIITKMQLAVMGRIDTPEKERKDFYLYVDEFQNFATESFADILSEARKYRLNLIVAHQYIEQLDEKVQAAVFGNVGTIVSFRVGAIDAEELVKEFTPRFEEEDMVNLPKYCIYLKLMIDGVSTEAFSAKTLPPLFEDKKFQNKNKIIDISRERYAKPKKIIEEKIVRWSGMNMEGDGPETIEVHKEIKTKKNFSLEQKNTLPENRSPEPPKNNFYKYEVKCHNCGADTKVSFLPDGVRPVYCKNCLEKIREEKKINIGPKKFNKPKFAPSTPPSIQKKEWSSPPIKTPLIKEEVSLKEAIAKVPVSFHKSKNPQKKIIVNTEPQNDNSKPKEIDKKIDFKKYNKVENNKPEIKKVVKSKNDNPFKKNLQPGQIIKF